MVQVNLMTPHLNTVSRFLPQDAWMVRNCMHKAATLGNADPATSSGIYRFGVPRIHAFATPFILAFSSAGYLIDGFKEGCSSLKDRQFSQAAKGLASNVGIALQCAVFAVAASGWAVMSALIGQGLLTLADPKESLADSCALYQTRLADLNRAINALVDKIVSSPEAMRAVATPCRENIGSSAPSTPGPVPAALPPSSEPAFSLSSISSEPAKTLGELLKDKEPFLKHVLPEFTPELQGVLGLDVGAYEAHIKGKSSAGIGAEYLALKGALQQSVEKLFPKNGNGPLDDVVPFLGAASDDDLQESVQKSLQILADEAARCGGVLKFSFAKRPVSSVFIKALHKINIPGSASLPVDFTGSLRTEQDNPVIAELMGNSRVAVTVGLSNCPLSDRAHFIPFTRAPAGAALEGGGRSGSMHDLPAYPTDVIDYQGKAISAEGLSQLIHLLSEGKVEELALELDVLQPEGYVEQLFGALKNNTSVTTLTLRGASAVLANDRALLDMFCANVTITTLNLPEAKLSASGIVELEDKEGRGVAMGSAPVAASPISIEEQNRLLGLLQSMFQCHLNPAQRSMNRAARQLVFQDEPLMTFGLRGMPIGSDEVNVIRELLSRDNLREIDLSNATFQGTAKDELVAVFAAALLKTKELQVVIMSGCKLSKADLEKITDSFVRNLTIRHGEFANNAPDFDLGVLQKALLVKRNPAALVARLQQAKFKAEAIHIDAVGLQLNMGRDGVEGLLLLIATDKVQDLRLDYMKSKEDKPGQALRRIEEIVKKISPDNKNLAVISLRGIGITPQLADSVMQQVAAHSTEASFIKKGAVKELHLEGNPMLEGWVGGWKDAYCTLFPDQAGRITFKSSPASSTTGAENSDPSRVSSLVGDVVGGSSADLRHADGAAASTK